VDLAEEGEHVVLAQGVELNALHHHHLAALGPEDGPVDDLFQALPVPAGEEGPGLGHPFRGLQEALPVGVLPDHLEPLCRQALEAAQVQLGFKGEPRLLYLHHLALHTDLLGLSPM